MKARHRELLTFDALESLIIHLGGLRDERKHVFILTDGFRLYTRNPSLGANDSSRNTGASSPMPIGVAPRLGDTPFGAGTKPAQCEADLADLAMLEHGNRLDQIAALARRNNVSLYPISQSGLAPATTSSRRGYGRGGYGGGGASSRTIFEMQSALRGLADDTDGLAIVNTNEVMNNLKKLMAATSAYYLLSYNPSNSTADGRFRKITVKVSRSGTRLRARPGYVAVRPADLKPVLPPEPPRRNDPVYTAVNAIANRSTGLLHLRSASWTRRETSGQSSAVLWVAGELDAQLRSNPAWAKGAAAEVILRPVRGGVPLIRRADVTNANAPVEFTFADAQLAPGVYSIQMQIVAANGEPIGDFARVTIPPEPAPLGEAILSRRPSGPGGRFTRTADPRFRRNEVLRFELPTDAGTAAIARLLDSKGGQLPVAVQVSEQPDVSEGFRWIVVDVPMIALAPSHYAIEVTQAESTRIAAFTVVP